MIKYESPNSFAILAIVEKDNYRLDIFDSENSWRSCVEPNNMITLVGKPNHQAIINALGEDFIYTGDEEVPQIPPVPESISARQVRLWLIRNGISLSQIENIIDNISDPLLRDSIKIEWEYAPYIERNHYMLTPLGQSLGLSELDIDNAFREAQYI